MQGSAGISRSLSRVWVQQECVDHVVDPKASVSIMATTTRVCGTYPTPRLRVLETHEPGRSRHGSSSQASHGTQCLFEVVQRRSNAPPSHQVVSDYILQQDRRLMLLSKTIRPDRKPSSSRGSLLHVKIVVDSIIQIKCLTDSIITDIAVE